MMNNSKPPTAILMMNLGGPATLEEVEPFLLELFRDHEIIHLPFQSILGPIIAKGHASKVQNHYAQIGGGSPILHWTKKQGEGMVQRLDRICPETAPHKFYVAFRYAPPFTRDALEQMKIDGVERAVAFTQYPQFSTSTTGSNLNELRRVISQMGFQYGFRWSVIDRWAVHPGYIRSIADSIRVGLQKLPSEERRDTFLLFSAHSLPLNVVKRGDPYPQEISNSVQAVMQALNLQNEFMVSYQSKVGPVRWLGPSTKAAIRLLGKQKRRSILVVPISFVNDHIETLYEIDMEYRELAERSGIKYFKRAPALNDSPVFLDALANIVAEHLHCKESGL